MIEIDCSLAPTQEEIIAALDNAPLYSLGIAKTATETARLKQRKPLRTWEDVSWIATYALMAGYIMGVRNERKRRSRSGRK